MLIKLPFQIMLINNNANNNEKTKIFLNALSASHITSPIAYLFFLEPNGRYIADIFLINHFDQLLLISKPNIIARLINHLTKYDLKKEFFYQQTQELNIYYTQTEKQNAYKDPRIENSFFSIQPTSQSCETNLDIYKKNIIENEIAEFEDFEEKRSIIPEFGKIASFIALNKGCYPGQELMQRISSMGQIRKTVKKTSHDDNKIIRILKQVNNNVLSLSFIEDKQN